MITIISVSYKSKELLEVNYNLVKLLNPNTQFQWIVVQNTPESELDKDLSMDDPRFMMIKGPTLTKVERENSFYRSIHHAKAINLALSYTNADLILTLDPDCFILMPDWITLVTKHMEKESLVFFGAPYHPKQFTHYRGFPTVICMFINRRLMQELNYFSLDFTPAFEGRVFLNESLNNAINYHRHPKHFLEFFSSSKRKPPLLLRDCLLIMKESFKYLAYSCFSLDFKKFCERLDQFNVRSCRDTGYKIYDHYRLLLKHQTLEIFALDHRSVSAKFFESILPDRYRSYPRNASFITKKSDLSFIEFGENGEQFFWNNQFFGFHRKGVADHLSDEVKAQFTEKTLNKIKNHIEEIKYKRTLPTTNEKSRAGALGAVPER
jgi:GT2 family glycosyltransferase